MRTKIIFEDRDILVIQKPSGLATQTARVDQQDVVSELRNYLTGSSYLGIVHRLDQPVEGLLVFGKTKSAAAFLTAQLGHKDKDGTLNKHYYCVICGKAANKDDQLVDYLYKDINNRAMVLSADAALKEPRAKQASLHYHILEETVVSAAANHSMLTVDKHQPSPICLSLADIQIDTGRFHQIRAQMAHGGMCLLGDSKYGNDSTRIISEQLGIRSAALCAYSLEFIHPVTKEKLHFQITPQGKAFSYFSL